MHANIPYPKEGVGEMEVDNLNDLPAARIKLGGIGRSSIYRLMDSGELRSVKVGRRRLIPDSAIADYVTRLKATA